MSCAIEPWIFFTIALRTTIPELIVSRRSCKACGWPTDPLQQKSLLVSQ